MKVGIMITIRLSHHLAIHYLKDSKETNYLMNVSGYILALGIVSLDRMVVRYICQLMKDIVHAMAIGYIKEN